ncbi:MAG: D-alanyl-D-alanine carboxypeptidase family protein [Gallionellaceae bacterium]|jgi:D-alanyl-D-alanine carboxypeptidase
MDGRDRPFIPVAAEAWRQLKRASARDDIKLFIVSVFRGIDQQADIVRRELETGLAIQNILIICAPPRFSEHHTGCAVDVSTAGCHALEVEFDQTAAYAWLTKRASEFGYYLTNPVGNALGYQYKPWYWCFKEKTADMSNLQTQ